MPIEMYDKHNELFLKHRLHGVTRVYQVPVLGIEYPRLEGTRDYTELALEQNILGFAAKEGFSACFKEDTTFKDLGSVAVAGSRVTFYNFADDNELKLKARKEGYQHSVEQKRSRQATK